MENLNNPQLPDIIGKYKVYDLADKPGGMAKVYLARSQDTSRVVAIKIPEWGRFQEDAKFRTLFLNEISIHKKIKHPNIIEYIDDGIHDGLPYLVTEYASGNDLSVLIRQEKVGTLKDAIYIIKKVCSALTLIHKHHLFHNDVSPRNIRITADGSVKLIDFGIASVSTPSSEELPDVYCKPHYAAPELFRGESPSAQTEVYSLGITFFEMLAGRLPYDTSDVNALKNQHFLMEIPILSTLNRTIPPSLDPIIRQMMEKLPGNRYRSPNSVVRALNALKLSDEVLGTKIQYPSIKRPNARVNSTQSYLTNSVSEEEPTDRESVRENSQTNGRHNKSFNPPSGKYRSSLWIYLGFGILGLVMLSISSIVLIKVAEAIFSRKNLAVKAQPIFTEPKPELEISRPQKPISKNDTQLTIQKLNDALSQGDFRKAQIFADKYIRATGWAQGDPYWTYLEIVNRALLLSAWTSSKIEKKRYKEIALRGINIIKKKSKDKDYRIKSEKYLKQFSDQN